MPVVNLEEPEWQQVMNLLSSAPWRDVHPLLMKIGGQLRGQAQAAQTGAAQSPLPNFPLTGNSKEALHE